MRFERAREYGKLYKLLYKDNLRRFNDYKSHELAAKFIAEVRKHELENSRHMEANQKSV